MASGVAVNDDVVTKYNELKIGHKFKYMVLSLSKDYTEIVVEKTADFNTTYEDFIADLPADQCRYAVYDFEFEKEGCKLSKLLFFVWAPDDAKIKQKMLTASSKDALKKKLVGMGPEIQATGLDEVDYTEVLIRCGGN